MLSQQVRAWLVPLLIAVPFAVLLSYAIFLLPGVMRRPVVVLVSLVPWVAIWLVDRRPLFAIGTWLVPSLILFGLAHLEGSTLFFHGLAAALVAVIGSITMWDRAWTAYGVALTRLGHRVAGTTMNELDRRTYREMAAALRPDVAERNAAQLLGDQEATIRATRVPAERVAKVRAPDEAWQSVIRASAAPGRAYAEMLEGTRPLDYDHVRRLVHARDKAIHELLRNRSWAYRLMTFRLRPNEPSVDR